MGNHSYTKNSMRGLAAAGDAGVRRVDSYRCDPRVLQFKEGFNVRVQNAELLAHIAAIKESIRDYITKGNPDNRVCAGGLLDVFPSLVVRITSDGSIEIVEGHSRTVAMRELIAEGFDIQEVDVKATSGDEADRTLIMVRSSQGKSLDPIEKALAFTRFADEFGWSFPDIARSCGGISTQRVEQLVLLGRGPQEIIVLVMEGKVTADSAIEILRKNREHPEEAVRFLQNLVAGKGSRPVGKAQTRISIPRKAQEAVFSAFTKGSKELGDQIEALEGKDGWEDEPVSVTLPAGVVKQLLALQGKDADVAAATAG